MEPWKSFWISLVVWGCFQKYRRWQPEIESKNEGSFWVGRDLQTEWTRKKSKAWGILRCFRKIYGKMIINEFQISYQFLFATLNVPSTILTTYYMAPLPTYPHINTFSMLSIIVQPNLPIFSRCSPVKGFAYIRLFIAGQRMIGWTNVFSELSFISQHLKTRVTKLSQSPALNFANVFALNGATK